MACLLGSCATGLALALPSQANAQETRRTVEIPGGDLKDALRRFIRQTGVQLVFKSNEIANVKTPGVSGVLDSEIALQALLRGTGFSAKTDASGAIAIVRRPLSMTTSSTRIARASLIQPVDAPTAAPPDSADSDIVVTAQRRVERLQDVPITLTAIGEELLERTNSQSLADIAKLTPALRIDYQGSFAQPTVRGVGTSLVTTGSGSNVGIYIDGFYSPVSLAADFQLLNVSSVQVLKGPQGTLFGRNTTGGAILVTTSTPSDEPSAVLQASYGRFDTQRYQGYVTGGLAEGIAVDAAGLYSRSDGFLRNIVTGSKNDAGYENWAVRLGLKLQPTSTVSFVLRYNHASTDDPSGIVTNALVVDGKPQVLGAIIPGAIIATKPREIAQAREFYSRIKTDSIQLTGEFDFDFAKLTSYTQYRKDRSAVASDIDYVSTPIFDVAYGSINKLITQEFLLSSNKGGRLQWTVGAFYLNWKERFPEALGSVGGGPFQILNNTFADTTSFAGYADFTYEVADRLFLTAGARYSYDRIADAFYRAGALAGNLDVQYPTLTSKRFTPRLVARYALDDRSSIFASYSQGYKAALVNMSGPADRTIKPEILNSFEVGYKYNTRQLTLDIAAYYYDYKDLQTSLLGDNGVSLTTNAAKSRVYGVEGQARFRPTSRFEVGAGVAYLDAKYKSYKDAPGRRQCLDLASCGANFGQFEQIQVDASGFRMMRAPKLTANFDANYSIDLGNSRLTLSGNIYYTSKIYFDITNDYPQKSYALVGLRAEWTDPSEQYSLAVFADNVTNAHYIRQASANNFGVGVVWGAPATFGVSAKVKL
jgi:iron complex outermembrane receptor protein